MASSPPLASLARARMPRLGGREAQERARTRPGLTPKGREPSVALYGSASCPGARPRGRPGRERRREPVQAVEHLVKRGPKRPQLLRQHRNFHTPASAPGLIQLQHLDQHPITGRRSCLTSCHPNRTTRRPADTGVSSSAPPGPAVKPRLHGFTPAGWPHPELYSLQRRFIERRSYCVPLDASVRSSFRVAPGARRQG